MEDDSSERILKHARTGASPSALSEVEDDSSERILKQAVGGSWLHVAAEVEDDSSERILKHGVCGRCSPCGEKWKTILQREY